MPAGGPGLGGDGVGGLEASLEAVGGLVGVGEVVAEPGQRRGSTQQVAGTGGLLGLAERGQGKQPQENEEDHQPDDPSHTAPLFHNAGMDRAATAAPHQSPLSHRTGCVRKPQASRAFSRTMCVL